MKKIFMFVLVFIMFLCTSFKISAEESDLVTDEIAVLDEQLPDEAENFMSESGISVSDPSAITEITPKMVISYMWNDFKEILKTPLKTLGILIIIIILAAVIENLGDTVSNEGTGKVYRIICILIVISIITVPIGNCISMTVSTINSGGDFMISFIPIFSGIVAAGGNITSAASYSVIVMAAAEIFVQIAKNYLLPVLSFSFAISIIESINPTISLSGFNNALKKFSSWGLGFIMTIFTGMLTIQSIVGTSADTLAVKAAKFAASNFIPIVGSAVSDAYSTIKSSMGILRSGVGSIGIISLVLTVLPAILCVLAVQLTIYIASLVAEMLNVTSIGGFLKNVSSVLSIAFSILICFSLMLIVSTTIVMMICMNMTNA